MTRTIWLPVMAGLLLTSPVVGAANAADLNATIGTKIVGGSCVTFFEDPHGATPLKKNEFMFLHIVNQCGKKWKIRVDRRPNKDFSKRCSASGSVRPFKFESNDNALEDQEHRLVVCQVASGDEKRTYVFQASESSPDRNPLNDMASPPIITSFLEIEVDP